VGIAPVDATLIGMAGKMAPATAGNWLARLEKRGAQGAGGRGESSTASRRLGKSGMLCWIFPISPA